jgi:hypothetical protein
MLQFPGINRSFETPGFNPASRRSGQIGLTPQSTTVSPPANRKDEIIGLHRFVQVLKPDHHGGGAGERTGILQGIDLVSREAFCSSFKNWPKAKGQANL